MAEEVLALLDLKGAEQILDIGCGNGKIRAEIAARVPKGSVVGVDPSREMIAFTSSHYGPIFDLKWQTLAACRIGKRSISSSLLMRSTG
jgi:trans-aconitate methyltransferase